LASNGVAPVDELALHSFGATPLIDCGLGTAPKA
jgi:hypothetical protein